MPLKLKDAQSWLDKMSAEFHTALLKSVSPADFSSLNDFIASSFGAPGGGTAPRNLDELWSQLENELTADRSGMSRVADALTRGASSNDVALALASRYDVPTPADRKDLRLARIAMLMAAQNMIRRGVEGLRDLGAKPSDVNRTVHQASAEKPDAAGDLSKEDFERLQKRAAVADVAGDAADDVLQRNQGLRERVDRVDEDMDVDPPNDPAPANTSAAFTDNFRTAVGNYRTVQPEELGNYDLATSAFRTGATLEQAAGGNGDRGVLAVVRDTVAALSAASAESRQRFFDSGNPDDLGKEATDRFRSERRDHRDPDQEHHDAPPTG